MKTQASETGSDRRRYDRVWLILPVVILLGFALRLHQLDSVPLRGDEAFSASYWAGLPLRESLAQIATLEPHPPLTYILFRAWGVLFGIQHETLLRLLPVLGNLIGIPALYALGKRLHSPGAGLLAALLWALHPFQIWHAQDFRNYAIWSGLSAITLWLAVRVLQERDVRDGWLYVVVATFTSLVFYMELFTLATLCLIALLLYRRQRGFVLRWLSLNAGIVVLTGLVFLFFQGALVGGGGYAGTTGGFDAGQWLTRFLPVLIFGDTLPPDWLTALWLILVPLLLFGLMLIARDRLHSAVFVGVLAVVPLLLLGLVSLRLSIFRPRYVMLAAPAYVLIVAMLVMLLTRWRAVGYGLATLILAGWIGLDTISLHSYYNNLVYTKAPDWKALAGYLDENVASDDLVIQKSVDASFGYYYNSYRGFDIQADETALPANFDQPAAEIQAELSRLQGDYRSLWTVGTTFESWQNAGVVETWLDENMQRTRETSIAGIPVQQYQNWQVNPDEVTGDSLATFAERVDLVDVRVFPPEPSGYLTVWLTWRPLRQTDVPHKIFVHLAGEMNPLTGTPLWSQSDDFPQRNRVGTDSWEPGTLYRDVHTLSLAGVPSGDYQLLVGLYDPTTGTRLMTADDRDAVVASQVLLTE